VGRAIDVRQLSRDERLDLIEQLWESLSEEERDSLPLTAEQEQELDKRLDALEKEGPVGLSSDELRQRIGSPEAEADVRAAFDW
jgi:putative addiction module component (TIGR02574 family)